MTGVQTCALPIWPVLDGGGSTSTFPFEIWRYHYIEGVGQNIEIEFVDRTMSGEYRMALDPNEKDALLHVPGAGLTNLEQLGQASKGDRMAPLSGDQTGMGLGGSNEFDRLERLARLNRPPALKFRDLEAVVNSRVSYNLLPFEIRTDFLRITSETVLAALTLQLNVRDIGFAGKDGVDHGAVNIYGSVSNLTGRVVQRFEDVVQVDVPSGQMSGYLNQSRAYWKALPLTPGLYRLNLVVKDINSGNLGTRAIALRVPRFDDDTLAASSLILADDIQKVSTREIGKGQFVIGATKVRPAVEQRFRRGQTMGIYLQVYNLALDEKSHKPSATVEYALLKDNSPLVRFTESPDQIAASGPQITLQKMLALNKLAPGEYKVEVRVTDQLARQTITPTASFRIE